MCRKYFITGELYFTVSGDESEARATLLAKMEDRNVNTVITGEGRV